MLRTRKMLSILKQIKIETGLKMIQTLKLSENDYQSSYYYVQEDNYSYNKQTVNLGRELETTKQNYQMEILKLKSPATETKILLEAFNSRRN